MINLAGLFGGGDKTSHIGGLFGNLGEAVRNNPDILLNTGLGILANPRNQAQGALMGLQMGQAAQARRKQQEKEADREEAFKRALGTYESKGVGDVKALGGGVTSQDLAPMSPNDVSSTGISRSDADLLQALGPQAGAGALMEMRKPQPAGPLVEVYDPSSPTGTTMVPRDQAAGMPGKMPSSMNFEVGPDGTVSFNQGRGGAGLTRATENKVQEKQFNASNALSRLSVIKSSFQPNLLTYGARAKQMGLSLTAKVDPSLLSADQRDFMVEYSNQKQATFDHLNVTLNELSGAAVNEHEYNRLKHSMPTLDDDAVTFEAKLDRSIQNQKLAVMRYNYFVSQGMTDANRISSVVSLDEMKSFIDKRGKEIMDSIIAANPGVSQEQAWGVAKEQLTREFGAL